MLTNGCQKGFEAGEGFDYRAYESASTIQFIKAAFDVAVPRHNMCANIGVEIVEWNIPVSTMMHARTGDPNGH